MDTQIIRERLETRRRSVLARYRTGLELAEEELAERQPEDAERAAEQHDAEVLAALGDVEVAELDRIVAAIGRLDAGTYGVCVRCDAPIGARRLEAVPETTSCITCAALTG